MKRLLLVALLGCLPVSAFAQTGAPEKKDIVIAVGGVANQIDKLPYAIALNKGYFKDEGLDVQSVVFGSGAKGLQALVAGGADATQGAYEHTIRMQAKGIDLTCLGVFARYPGNVLLKVKGKGDGIKTIADLKGKTIGVTAPGSASNNFVALLLEKAGVGWKSANYVGVGAGSSAVAAVRTGKELDALVSLDPTVTELVDGGDVEVMVDSRIAEGAKQAFGGDYLAGCIYVKSEFIKANPNSAQALTNAMVRSMQWLRTASVDDIMASLPEEYYSGNKDIYRKAVEKNLSAFTWDGIVTPEAAKNVYDSIALMDPALQSAKLDLSKTYDNSFTERALKKYGSAGN